MFLQTVAHLKDSEEAKQIEEDDCDGHLACKDEEWEVEGVAGDDGLVQEVHAEAADEVEGGRGDCTGLALLVQHVGQKSQLLLLSLPDSITEQVAECPPL